MTKEERDNLLTERAKNIVSILRKADKKISLAKLAELSGLKKEQVKAAVKFQRRWFIEHPEACGRVYIISGRKGYSLPKTDNDYVDFYKSLYSWGISVLVTISAVGKYLSSKGYNVSQLRCDAIGGDGELTDEIGNWQGGEEEWS